MGETLRDALAKLPAPRIAVLRALKLGDLLCAVPALRALRAGAPHAKITLVGLPWARAFVNRYPKYLDDFCEFPGFPGLPERTVQVDKVPPFLFAMQQMRWDLALQLHGSGSFVNPLITLFAARRTAGFYTPGDYCPDQAAFLPYPGEGLEIHRLLKLVEHLAFPVMGDHLEFPLQAEDFRRLENLPRAESLSSRAYVCVHPGASVPGRQWQVQGFARVAFALREKNFTIVLTGSAEESGLTRAVHEASGVPCLDLAGQTDLGMLAALLHGARLLVCNDTGVSHLAAALQTPSVVISTGANPARWAPQNRRLHHVLCATNELCAQDVLDAALQACRDTTCPPREPAFSFANPKSPVL